jgi:hypothetical protein
MGDLSMLRKADRSRLVRRAITAEDRAAIASEERGPPLGQELLFLIFPAIIVAAAAYGGLVLLGSLTAWWEGGPGIAVAAIAIAGIAVGRAGLQRRNYVTPGSEERARDAASGEVNEITFAVTAAKAFREPEHGTPMYFLKLDDGRVFFDTVGSSMGEPGWEKALGSIAEGQLPRKTLHLLFGIESGSILCTRYSGEPVRPESVNVLKGNPSYWPDPATFRKTNWDDVEKQFAAKLN